jgi:hypothetical protein
MKCDNILDLDRLEVCNRISNYNLQRQMTLQTATISYCNPLQRITIRDRGSLQSHLSLQIIHTSGLRYV